MLDDDQNDSRLCCLELKDRIFKRDCKRVFRMNLKREKVVRTEGKKANSGLEQKAKLPKRYSFNIK